MTLQFGQEISMTSEMSKYISHYIVSGTNNAGEKIKRTIDPLMFSDHGTACNAGLRFLRAHIVKGAIWSVSPAQEGGKPKKVLIERVGGAPDKISKILASASKRLTKAGVMGEITLVTNDGKRFTVDNF